MDPLTHALAGATLAWIATGERLGRRSLLIGAGAALLPDVDVLIRSASDPLLAIEHHRGFTHSLLFVPIGGIVAALPFAARLERMQWRWVALAGILAYASHTLLDAATTYGTQWLWPFSRYRVGLDAISIIDPLFTFVLLVGLIAARLHIAMDDPDGVGHGQHLTHRRHDLQHPRQGQPAAAQSELARHGAAVE